MDEFLIAAATQFAPHAALPPAVLVTVAIVEGSVPREPGARMLVDATRQWGTVGGGHLELRGVETARAMLAAGANGAHLRRLERFPLGPSLGQCCGGVVHLAFELADKDHLALLAARRNEDCWRLVALDGEPDLALCDANGQPVQGRAPNFDATRGTHVLRDAEGRRWLADLVAAPRAHLMLFGAGHVGAAIVRALGDLPCHVTWVDEREDLFPANLPHNVAVEATDTPEALAAGAPPGTSFLVMTHSHALDQRLAETILKRQKVDATPDWFGLIGSSTKRAQFERRLRERGIEQERLDAMVCPIGIPGIESKLPAAIAVAVAAQLLMVWEAAAQPERT
jgi:xanthine dehydrogenase accessory factor